MGTLNIWNFDGPNGTAITDTGLAKAGTGTVLYSTADTARGSSGGRATAADASTVVARLTASVGSTTMAVGGFLKTLAANPAAVATLCTARSGTSAANAAVLRLQEAVDGSIGWSDISGTFRQVVPAASVSAGTFYYWDVTAVVGTATAAPYNGSVTVTVYNSAGTQLGTNTLTTAAIGTAAVTMADVGANSSATPGYSVGFDYVRMENDRTTPFGFPATGANAAPTVTPGSAQTVTGTTASLSGSATAAAGTMSSAVWSLLSTTAGSNPTVGSTTNTGGGTATITAAASVTGLAAKSTNVFRLTATDNGNPAATTTGDVTVYVSGTPVAPNRVISNAGGWVAVNAASLDVAVNKATDTDTSYIETPATPSAASVILGVEPIALGDETITVRLRYQGTGTFTCTPKLYSGSTLITTAATPITLTSAFANYPIPLSPSENANVANRNDIRVELVATQS